MACHFPMKTFAGILIEFLNLLMKDSEQTLDGNDTIQQHDILLKQVFLMQLLETLK